MLKRGQRHAAICALAGVAGWSGIARAAPLPLYDTTNESTALAPLPSAAPCGGFAVACSAAPVAAQKTLPFDYGLAVSGTVGGSSHGAFGGAAISGWIKPKDIPVTVYFEYEQLRPIGRTR